MKNVDLLVETLSKIERQMHLDLSEPCIERGGVSTNHKGVLAQYLVTTIPCGTKNSKVYLCHACHNGNCSNPKHLYWGTHTENMQDKVNRPGYVHPRKGKPGRKWTDETRRKVSETLKGRPSNNQSGINQYNK